MAKYIVTLQLEGARQSSVEKRMREALPAGTSFTVSKDKTAESRADRLSEAEALVEDAKNIVEELKDEMETWRDSIPENLQGGEKYSQVEDACNALEEIQSNLEQCEFGSVDFPGMF